MVQFGKNLLEHRYEPWAKYYLDYGSLKQRLAKYRKKNKQLLLQDVPPPPPNTSYQAQIEWGSPVRRGGSPAMSMPSPAMSMPSPQLSHDGSNSSLHQPSHHPDPRDFETYLEDEVEKIGLFFLQIQGEIAADLNALRLKQAEFLGDLELGQELLDPQQLLQRAEEANKGPTLEQFFAEFHALAITLLRLIHFVEANVTGIRKILKKHDKVTKKHLTAQFVSFRLAGKSKQLKHLWTDMLLHHYEGITALNATLKVALTELKNLEFQQQLSRQGRLSLTASTTDVNGTKPPNGKPPLPTKKGRHQPVKSMPNFFIPLEDVAEAIVQSQAITPNSKSSMTPQPLSSKKPYGSSQQLLEMQSGGKTSSHALDAVLLKVEAARRRMKVSSNTFQDMLAAQIVMLEPTGSEDEDRIPDEDDDEGASPIDEKWLSHFLNLISTFLYMTNYYVVAPTSGHYAEMLGADEALSGIIIGMTPIAALVSTVLYSWWTSYSYKSALIFASTCSILGNIFYALGLPYNSMTFVIIGRLLNGFGSARSINRRYIADTFPPRQRTAQSANFVTAGALGMAAGPAIASLLHIGSSSSVNSSGSIQTPTNLWWTPENSPGWFMFVLWSTFLVLLCLHFEDPPKHVAAQEKKAVSSGVEATKEEKEALVARESINSDQDLFDSDREPQKEVSIWKNIPVMTTFVVYFILKTVLECLLSSTATLTGFYFQWDSSVSGIYLAILGLLMLPANLGIAILARNHDDRELIVGCEIAMLVGCIGVIQYTHRESYTAIQYVLFSVVIFLSTNGLEGPNMSLLSKTIPKSWSRGIFNVGLLATEAGTFGRAVGDLLLTYWGFEGMATVLNDTFRTMSILSGIALGLTLYVYEDMEPSEKDY